MSVICSFSAVVGRVAQPLQEFLDDDLFAGERENPFPVVGQLRPFASERAMLNERDNAGESEDE